MPQNFSELTPNAHFTEFNLNLCLFNIVNTSVTSLVWSDYLLLLTNISSMYTSMVLPRTGSNIFVTILGIFQSKRHDLVIEYALRGDECSFLLVGLVHGNLVITSVYIQEAHLDMTRVRVHQLVDLWQWESVFWASSIATCEMNTDPLFVCLLFYHDCVGQPTRVKNFSSTCWRARV